MIGADHVHTAATVRSRQRTFVPPSESYLPYAQAQDDTAVLDQLFYATVDECPDPNCRPLLLDRVAADVEATRKLVDWACHIASEMYCELPAELVDEEVAADTVFHPSPFFCRLAAEYHNPGSAFNAVYATYGTDQRRQVADNAVVLVDGFQVWWTDFLYQ
ncbi:hypothetical protein OG909_32700 [Streptomyces sp. NBC_01754]|uniref:hypothetical protein n=1 Tax=Streptomyces sp. NBC_01754 TaxID=2975930 RepID=UPI002DD90F43|nr:hypothetical protein [Streptomyces sp. NBC_01754]WSC90817.1 hypothetical protein OG909_00010 [Streptomyces sp. NBC_01754]WSC96688.1 hypothetical protein OG909_32700 [Streptomyces sp. NBC_01754]